MTQQPLGPEPSPGIPQSQSSFPSTLQVPEVPVPLRKQLEAQESHSRLHEEMAEYWRTRWHHVAVALKFKEEELQRLQRQSGTWPPQELWDPRSAKELESAVWTLPEANGLSLWIQSWVLSRTGPVGPLLGSLDLEQKSSSRTEDWTHKTWELSTALLFTS
ncbi:uncharacterized protein [Chlorocebus sabaeus]|uniref:uncharacterized protein isoform X4 n=1 Tax=Chlorocebus sabaeus TaxID=60711 RepID=UPI003BF96DBF